jgi:hypothetical protein
MIKKISMKVLFISLLIINLSLVSAQFYGGDVPSSFMGGNYQIYGRSINPQFNQPGFGLGSGINPRDYWGNFDREDCKERQDVILTIPPGGCSPAVVRSDLLEEQNVPVFCKVSSIQVNPLIDVTRIRSIRFKGEYPPGVSGVSYYPARAAVRSSNKLIGSPVVDNVGYLVVVLRRFDSEENMPDWLEGNVTAVIDYDSEGAFGIGQHDFYLSELDDEEWEREYKEYGFWKGKGFIRLEHVDENSARISIYRDANYKETSITLGERETSGDIYLGGSYCAAGMNIKVQDIGYPVDSVLLKVDDQEMWVGDNGRFLDGKCRVRNIDPSYVGGGSVRISCSGTRSFSLSLNDGGASFSVDSPLNEKDKTDEYKVGEVVKQSGDDEIRLAYVGRYKNAKSNYVILVKDGIGGNRFYDMGNFISRRENSWKNMPAVEIAKILKSMVLFKGWEDMINYGREYEGSEHRFYQILASKLKSQYDLKNEDIRILVGVGAEWNEQDIILEEPVSGTEFLDKEENKLLKEYYDETIDNYEEVFESN